MKQTRSQKQKAQEKFYGNPKGNGRFVLKVMLSGKKPEKSHDDFVQEYEMPDYWGKICPNALEYMHFEEEDYAEV